MFAAKKPSCNKASGGAGSKSNAFVYGTSIFKLDTIKTYETSRFHRASSSKSSNNLKRVSQTPVGKVLMV